MKYTAHVPVEQYGFVSVEWEDEKIDAKDVYDRIANQFKPQPVNELPAKEMDEFVQKMLEGEANHIEMYERMSKSQQNLIQIIKRAIKRIEYKNK